MASVSSHNETLFSRRIFAVLSLILMGSLFSGIYFEQSALFLLPFAVLMVLVALIDFTKLYFLLIFVIPITIEFYLPNGLGIDLPAEILLMGLTVLSPFIFLINWKKEDLKLFQNPIIIALIFHLLWILISGFLGKDIVIGLKFFIAKIWYVIPFLFLSFYVFRSKQNYKLFFWVLAIPLSLSIIYVLVKHSTYGFSFSDVNSAVSPIYRNHVNYGLLMAIFLPFCWAFYGWYEKNSLERLIIMGMIVLILIGIYFTYTRAAQLAVIIGIASYFVVKFRFVIISLISAAIVVLLLGIFLINNDKYLDYAPQYEKTITHESFDNLLEATVKMEDISTMERLYRWVAAGHSIAVSFR